MHLLGRTEIEIIIQLMCIELEDVQWVVWVGYKFWSELGDMVELAGAVRHVKRQCVIETIHHEVVGLVTGERCEIRAVAVEVTRVD